MTTLHAQVPETLLNDAMQVAKQEHVTLDELVSKALSARIALKLTHATIQERAKRGDLSKFDQIMAKVPDVPPVPGDEL